MQFISSFCSRVLFMDHGQVDVDADDPKDAIDRYYSLVGEDKNVAGLGTVVINAVTIRGFNEKGKPSGDTLAQGSPASIDVEFTVREEGETALLSVSIDDIGYAQVITCPLVDEAGQPLEFGRGEHKVTVDLGKVELNSGKYSILVSASGALTRHSLVRSQGNAPFRVTAKNNAWSKIVRPVVPSI
jgi:hypothetical protein